MNGEKKAAGKTAKAQAARAARIQAEFEARKAALTELAEAYPDTLAAIDEYSGAYLEEGLEGNARRFACQLSNDTACVSSFWSPYAAEAMATVGVVGDAPGDAVPADVVAGLVYLRHRAPAVFARLVAMDSALGAALPTEGGDFAASAILMRAALARAA